MASIRSQMVLRRIPRPLSRSLRAQPTVLQFQRRNLVSHQDAAYQQASYQKAESVGDKRFSEFDLAGKVFVVTGAACRPLQSLEQIQYYCRRG